MPTITGWGSTTTSLGSTPSPAHLTARPNRCKKGRDVRAPYVVAFAQKCTA